MSYVSKVLICVSLGLASINLTACGSGGGGGGGVTPLNQEGKEKVIAINRSQKELTKAIDGTKPPTANARTNAQLNDDDRQRMTEKLKSNCSIEFKDAPQSPQPPYDERWSSRVNGTTCPINFVMSGHMKGTGSSTGGSNSTQMKLEFAVLDSEFQKLTDIQSTTMQVSLSNQWQVTGNTYSMQGEGSGQGLIQSRRFGSVAMEFQFSIKSDSSSSNGGITISQLTILKFSDFEARLNHIQTFQGQSMTERYLVNGQEVSKQEWDELNANEVVQGRHASCANVFGCSYL